jgi:autotransporter-associated beta strand protein
MVIRANRTLNSRFLMALVIAGVGGGLGKSLNAATIDWNGSTNSTWSTGTNWAGSVAAANSLVTDIARFSAASYPNQPDAGTTSINGLIIGDGVTVTPALNISGTLLSIGGSGIVVNANAGTSNTISSPIQIGISQTWSVATGTSLTITGAVSRNTGTTLNVQGTGTLTSSQANDATGIIGPWMTVGSGNATRFATNSISGGGGTIGAYTGTVITSADSLTSPSTNYDLSLAATSATTADRAANVVRYGGSTNSGRTITLGGAAATNFNLTLNGLLNAGNSATSLLTISNGAGNTGSVVIGDDQELVLNAATGGITLNVPVMETVSGGSIVIAGTGPVSFNNTVQSTYTGSVSINSGSTLTTNQTTARGTNLNNVVYLSGTFGTSNNVIAGLNDGLGGAGTVTTTSTSAKALTISGGGNYSFSGTITNGVNVNALVSIRMNGAGTQALSGPSTNTGATSLLAGVLSVNSLADGLSPSPIGASTNVASNLVFNGGTLQYTGTGHSTNRLFTLDVNGGTIDASGASNAALTFSNPGAIGTTIGGIRTLTLTGSSAGANTMTPIITNSTGVATSLTKAGTGTWVLAGANTFTGNTAVNNGILKLAPTGSINDSAQIAVESAGTFDVSAVAGYTVAAQTLTGDNGNVLGNASFGSTSSFLADLDLASPSTPTLNFSSNLDIIPGAALTFSGTPDGTSTYVLATYGGILSGTFALTEPDGYTLDYGDGSNSQITLVPTAAPIPEPASLAILGLGLGALLRRRVR